MSYCKSCGKEYTADERFCSGCGAPLNEQSQGQSQNAYQQPVNNVTDTSNDTAMGVLAYLGPLVLVPILAAPKSAFARFHANQGLVLIITEIAYSVALEIVVSILRIISWNLGSLVRTILGFGWLAFLALVITGIINAVQGSMKELPIIGGFKILK